MNDGLSSSMKDLDLDDFSTLSLARNHWAQGRADQAIAAFNQAMAERPDNVRALCETAQACSQVTQIAMMEKLLQRAEQLAGGDPRVMPLIARIYKQGHRPHAAIVALESLRTAHPNLIDPPLLAELAELYEKIGETDKALKAVQQSAARAPDRPEPLVIKARLLRRKKFFSDADALIQQTIDSPNAQPWVIANAWAERCHIRDAQDEYDAAADAIEQCKVIIRQMPEAQKNMAQAQQLNMLFQQIYQQIDQSVIDRWQSEDLPADPRVSGVAFLLGFPRTGTTLLEQMLGEHPKLIDTPEKPVFTDIFRAMCKPTGQEPLSLESIDNIPRERLINLRQAYLDRMQAIADEAFAKHVHLDKNPNYMSLIAGIYRLFPDAKFIVALRDPRDVIVSVYLRLFTMSEFSSAFLAWETTVAMYCFDMGIWLRMKSMMKDNFIEVRYEDTINDPERQTRKCFDFLGLRWDPAVMDYRENTTGKLVNSPSHDTVREPIYQHAAGRWKRYEKYLEPFMERLRPFVETFGYE